MDDSIAPLYLKQWYALHTRSRHEKKVEALIRGKDIDTYLPVRKILRKWSDRKKLVEFPLFPGYLFVHLPLSDKNRVLQIKGVVRMLGSYMPEAIPEEQIETLKCFENHEVVVDPYLHLQPGKAVKVARGPLKGCSGILVRKKTKYRLVVNLKVLLQSASVEIDASDVENL